MNFTFEPYVGCYYGKPESLFNKKILIVGASHYHYCDKCMRKYVIFDNGKYKKTKNGAHLICFCDPPELEREFTRDVVNDHLNVKSLIGYTKFTNAVLHPEINSSEDERQAFFSSVIFYNYLQEFEGVDSRDQHPEKFCDEK